MVVSHDAEQVGNLGDPPPVVFLFRFNVVPVIRHCYNDPPDSERKYGSPAIQAVSLGLPVPVTL